MILSFELTMPNVGSWNGKWSGADRKYFIIRKMSERFFNKQEHFSEIKSKGFANFYYGWDDGWGANVRVEIIDGIKSRKRRKQSNGFCGYDWMVDSIILHGKILTEAERKKELQSEERQASNG